MKINIDDLDGEGTIFITTDDGTKSIGHVEEEYVDIMQDVLKAFHFYSEEVKRLREENGDDYDALKKHIAQLVQEVKQFNEMKKWLLENHPDVILQYTYGRVD